LGKLEYGGRSDREKRGHRKHPRENFKPPPEVKICNLRPEEKKLGGKILPEKGDKGENNHRKHWRTLITKSVVEATWGGVGMRVITSPKGSQKANLERRGWIYLFPCLKRVPSMGKGESGMLSENAKNKIRWRRRLE